MSEKGIIRKILMVGLTFIAICALTKPIFADESERTVNVGYYLFDSFQELNEEGSYSGYGYDYYKQIAQYTHWQYNFVQASFSECFEGLKTGDVDVICGIERTSEREVYADFSKYPVSTTQSELYARRDDARLYYESFSDFNGKRVAVMKGNKQTERLDAYCLEHGFSLEKAEFASQAEMEQALEEKKVDLIFATNVNSMDDVKIVAKFEEIPLYFAITKGNEEVLKGINDAMWQIMNISPDFKNSLADKYLNTGNNLLPAYTKSEIEFINSKATISAIINDNWRPIAWVDESDQSFHGIGIDVLNKIANYSGLNIKYYTKSQYEKQVLVDPSIGENVITLLSNDNEWADKNYVYLSNIILETPVVLVAKKANVDTQNMVIALPKDYYTTWRIEKKKLKNKIRYYNDVEACLRAVKDGEADVTYTNNSCAGYYLPYYEFRNLYTLSLTNINENLSVAIGKQSNQDLLSIINKSLLCLSNEEMDSIVIQNNVRDENYNEIYRNVLIVCAIILFLGFITFKMINDKKQNKILYLKNKQLGDAVSQADKANEAKSEFLSRMSHEIRTPMNAIIGITTIAKNYAGNKEKTEEYLDKIKASSKMLINIINDVLDMSAIENKKLKIAHEPFDLKVAISSVASMYYTQCKQKGIEFEMLLSDVTQEVVIGDSLRLNQILLNLISNAYKFTKKGGKIKVVITQREKSEDRVFMRFSVSDTGCGMSEEMKTRIFKPFEQESAKTALNHGGSGLGLSITKNIVDLMQGAIDVQSEEGKGSTFIVDLPFGMDKDAVTYGDRKFHEVRALVVDDDEETREYTSIVLDRIGVHYEVATNGIEALEMVKNAHDIGWGYDVCLIDWKMPGLSGIEVTKKIRELYDEDTIIIIVSAYDLSEVEDEAKSVGANLFVSKPLFQSTIYNVLMSLSGGKYTKIPVEEKSYDFTGKTVLLAEDNALNREIAVELLQMVGLTVRCATDGKDALEQFENSNEGTFDAILMDIQMPIMDGHEASKAIRKSKHPQANSIHIYAMTANAFAEDVAAAHSAGMNGHIAKPIDTKNLYATLAKGFEIQD